MQRAGDKKKQKSEKERAKVRAVDKVSGSACGHLARWAGRRARVGRVSGEGRWGKSDGTVGKRQRGSKLSNQQEKAKAKAQEV